MHITVHINRSRHVSLKIAQISKNRNIGSHTNCWIYYNFTDHNWPACGRGGGKRETTLEYMDLSLAILKTVFYRVPVRIF